VPCAFGSLAYYVPGKAFDGVRDRGLLPHYQKLPWIPSDEQWQNVLRSLKGEWLRNQVMMLIAYYGALRRKVVFWYASRYTN